MPHKVRELATMGLGRCFKVTLQTHAPKNFRSRWWGAECRVGRAQTRVLIFINIISIDPISLVLSRTLFIVKSISNFKSRFSFLSSSICLFRSVQTIISENVDHVHYNHILKLKTHGQNNEDINFFLFFSDYQLILQKNLFLFITFKPT